MARQLLILAGLVVILLAGCTGDTAPQDDSDRPSADSRGKSMSEMTMEPQRESWEVRKARAMARTKGVKIALGIPRDKRFFEKLDKGG